MAWETRHNRSKYYYRKKRIHGRVVSEYIGAGPGALLGELQDQMRREEMQELRCELSVLQEQDLEIDQAINFSVDMAKAILLLAGCHTHKGEWRHRRGKFSE